LEQQHNKSQSELLSEVQKLISAEDLKKYRTVAQNIKVEPKLLEYIAAIIVETRNNSAIFLGASTRASLALLKASKASAALRGRDFIIPEDIQSMAPPVLRHRIMLSPEKEMEGITADQLVEIIIKSVEVPR
jgi:MoxR-like ATPase